MRRPVLAGLRRRGARASRLGRLLRATRAVRVLNRDELVRRATAESLLWDLPPLDEGEPDPSLSGPVRPTPEPRPGVQIDDAHPTEGRPPFVAELHDVRLTGPVPLALTPDGRIVKQVLISSDDDDGRVDRALQEGVREQGIGPTLRGLRRRAPAPALELECAAVLSGRSNAYYHFVCDQLPKLRGVEHYAAETGRMPTLILHRDTTRWQRELLEIAGAGRDDTIEWPGGEARVERLVVPSHAEVTPGTCAWLRERLWAGADRVLADGSRPGPGARLLISRRDARRTRYIADEERLMEALSDLGFQLVTLSEISEATTIALFREAEIVVGTHGSGLTNALYCERASILEIFGSSIRPYFFRLARAIGLPYRYELADESEGEVRIDVGRLVAVVHEMLQPDR